jgi:hypothetical protein
LRELSTEKQTFSLFRYVSAACHICDRGVLALSLKEVMTLLDENVCPQINVENTKCMHMSRYQTVGQSHCIKVANISFENVVKLRYSVKTAADQICMQEEIKNRLNSVNACYCAGQNLIVLCVIYINRKIIICKTIILPVVLYGCETWSVTLRQDTD